MLIFIVYLFLLIYLFFSLLLLFITFLSNLSSPFYNKLTSYECGFSSVGPIQSSFSVHFYSLILIFVVFDLEVVFLLGFINTNSSSALLFVIFWVFIYTTYYLEVYFGSFSWLN